MAVYICYTQLLFFDCCTYFKVYGETGFDESTLPHLFILIANDQNYAFYRAAYREAEKILHAHIYLREYNI